MIPDSFSCVTHYELLIEFIEGCSKTSAMNLLRKLKTRQVGKFSRKGTRGHVAIESGCSQFLTAFRQTSLH